MALNTEPEIMASLAASRIPENLHGGIMRYIVHGIKPGGFLSAVFENDLMEAFGRADTQSQACMHHIIGWVYNHCPRAAWGTPDAIERWMKWHAEQRAKRKEEAP